MKLVVGLGNIGKEYENTYHNAGFIVIDKLAEEFSVRFNNRSCDADWGDTNISGEKVIFAKPRTYMNESGKSVKSFMKKFNIKIEDVFVIVDDIDQAIGCVRIRKTGSAGTHNGLKSIESQLGTQEYKRIKIGIDRSNVIPVIDWVLQKFTNDEMASINQAIEVASKACIDFIEGKRTGHFEIYK